MSIDITPDGRQVRGRGGASVKSNLEQYHLASRFIDAITCDASKHPWRSGFKFDAIVCDRKVSAQSRSVANFFVAPYGIRAGAKRLGSRKVENAACYLADGTLAHLYDCI